MASRHSPCPFQDGSPHLLTSYRLLFTCFLLSQFCLSLISASKDTPASSYRIASLVDTSSSTGSLRPLRDSHRMKRDPDPPAQLQYMRVTKLHNKCSDGLVRLINTRVDANGKYKNFTYTELLFKSTVPGNDQFTQFTIESVRFQNLYLCFNKRGRLVAKHLEKKRNRIRRRCMFTEEITPDKYSIFKSVADTKWQIGFRKKGTPLMGFKTKPGKEDCYKFQKIDTPLISKGTSQAQSPAVFRDAFKKLVKKRLQTEGRRRRARSRRRKNKKRDNT